MDQVKTPGKPRHPDRIALAESELTKIDTWRAQIVAAQRGVRLSRSDLVRWLNETKASELTAAEALAVGRRHFDEAKERLARAMERTHETPQEPKLTRPKYRQVWVPAKIEGNRYIEGHRLYIIEDPGQWTE